MGPVWMTARTSPCLFAIRALEGLQVAREEKDILKEIQCGMEAEDQEEVVITVVKEVSDQIHEVLRVVPREQSTLP